MSVNSTSPATLFGGTWEQLKDRFLLGAGDTYSNGATGGEATHTLTVNEMPSHNHTYNKGTTNVYETVFASNDAQLGYGASSGATAFKGGYASIGNTGGDSNGNTVPHNNMPPYLAVYMWKRTS